ncbi:MAG: trypsin-like peptidase domain-containing protein [Firmicutes bacterium]|nr:trypsin-like peptidase domain-containing protein [Bacillota bacterium]
MLTLIGFDVLLIQTESDISNDIDKLNLSKKIPAGDFNENANIPEYRFESGNYAKPPLAQPAVSAAVNSNSSAVLPAANGINTAAIPDLPRIKIPNQRTAKSGKNDITAEGSGSQIREKSYEELALLSSSVVLITLHNAAGQILGTGSGIMIGKNGFILTNHHVACRGTLLSVTIEEDDQIYETNEIIKYNQHLDLALIRIDRQLNPIPIYKNDKKPVRGQKVVAIGSPLGLFNSVSDGIISGFRKLDGVEMIQFTAPISHGSSGGALLNMNGEVIGISTAGMDHGQNINLAVGYEYINSFIQGFINY